VAGRALVFSNPDIVQLVKSDFVAYAGDQWYLHRQKDAIGEFFWKVVQQGLNRNRPMEQTRQGIYAATADGELFGSINSWSAERTLGILRQAVEKWKQRPEAKVAIDERPAVDTQYDRKPPAGGLILNTFTRIPLELQGEQWTTNRATGRDHMWLTREEWRSLLPATWKTGVRYPVPGAVAERLLRFHLVDNVRGEPNMWRRHEILEGSLTLMVTNATTGRLRLEGTARMQAAGDGRASDRGYDARLQGDLTYDRKQSRFTRFDVLSWGEAWGHGTYTRRAPPGRFPLVIALSIAGNSGADRVPPQGSRHREDYFDTLQAAR
jgi:hypothetical protein